MPPPDLAVRGAPIMPERTRADAALKENRSALT